MPGAWTLRLPAPPAERVELRKDPRGGGGEGGGEGEVLKAEPRL